jgi:multidrug efflux pump subunit AcrA (membrane-fusion protein)
VSNGHDEDRPITANDLAKLTDRLDDLAAAQDELREASTAHERTEAREDVAEAKADLDALASTLGVSRKTLDASIAAAKREDDKAKLRPIIAEILAEEKDKTLADTDENDTTGTDVETDEDEVASTKAEKPKPKPKPREQPQDTGPVAEHWSERSIGEMVR